MKDRPTDRRKTCRVVTWRQSSRNPMRYWVTLDCGRSRWMETSKVNGPTYTSLCRRSNDHGV